MIIITIITTITMGTIIITIRPIRMPTIRWGRKACASI